MHPSLKKNTGWLTSDKVGSPKHKVIEILCLKKHSAGQQAIWCLFIQITLRLIYTFLPSNMYHHWIQVYIYQCAHHFTMAAAKPWEKTGLWNLVGEPCTNSHMTKAPCEIQVHRAKSTEHFKRITILNLKQRVNAYFNAELIPSLFSFWYSK